MERCAWAKKELDIRYHDEEWGNPHHSEASLFELLILETMQAGLSWSTILVKRENYREALDQFDYHKIASYSDEKVEELMNNAGIIRNRLKIKSIIKNAQAFIKVQKEWGSFDRYLWSFVDYQTIDNQFETIAEVPAQTELSNQLAKDLKKRGFSFIGPVTCYAFMQAAGLINDHTMNCSYRMAVNYDK
ncbi:DNA-3-methyladenine glycosylase I [Carnobacterium divergens]|uniref:DNA-3-methyladenine glycosylase I n=1 Tax=Carnobacterium divergens TaxID=2748 RepID=UPI001072E3C7|nr:DNA-3-methyladenine glycosylase I [Carnobacterium divergens]TFJ39009.1 DNA-3-methyladenine glycosylase I [Carnobacterium divergens]TFJ48244.1 DNA-3-methyladenine glycosylase I [Carnobacterium divergens]TFJ53208.1 DNA-3-methyladenine glycosylase I [Carnobacterium divergens]TFJ57295.1 DNA-3-methyladenine glycosylase I [Carnobacterium divergens]TFJ68998.1 DNA-3-methyladenine glycosylase I [Carnobacterium divergens]